MSIYLEQINPACIAKLTTDRVLIHPCDPTDKKVLINIVDKRLSVYLRTKDNSLIFIQKITNDEELIIHQLGGC